MLNYFPRNSATTAFERPEDMPEALHALLIQRGIASAEEAERFLHPDARSLLDPFLLSDMGAAVDIIRAAMAAGDTICVYGDYDVDGVSASSIMKLWLEAQGADVFVYLPSRHNEGYGLNEPAIREIAAKAKLLVTVDCGVTSVALVALAKALGLNVIVTDHHRPGDQLPDCPVVNPLLNDYPFPCLCGAGVAWKLVWALSGEIPMALIDIAALATVADVVSLTGENRAIVAMGLQAINRHPRPGIAALIEAAGLSGKPVTSTAIAFQLAPRLNAGGRLDTALRPFELVTTDDPDRARTLAEELNDENSARQAIEKQMLREAEAQLKDFDFIRHRAIILSGAGWNPGVIGLTASRLVEKYHYPVIMLSDQGDKLTGSCRSIEGVDIFEALSGCAEHLQRFGGHRQAAGLTLSPERLPGFIEAMDRWLSTHILPEVYIPALPYDAALSLDAVTPGLIAALEGLQPTGFGNPAPVFRALAQVVEARPVGMDGAHLRLTLSQEGHRIGGIAFREGPRAGELQGDCAVDALFVPKLNSYMGVTSAQLEVRAINNADANARIASIIGEEMSLQCDFLTEIIYNKKIDPSKPAPETIDRATLVEWLNASPQGTLMIAGDAASAALAAGLGPCDVHIGKLPDDPRAFNAVCLCPGPGPLPPSYRRAVLLGAPAEAVQTLDARYRLDTRPEWTQSIPDIDAMRDAYRALMELCRRPVRFTSLQQLAQLTAEDCGTDRLTALLSLMAIEDMGLFKYDFGAVPARLVRLNKKKADPAESAVWSMLQRWRDAL